METRVDLIELAPDGTIHVRLVKVAVATGQPSYHRTVILPGVSPADQLAAVNADLAGLGAGLVNPGDWARVEQVVSSEHGKARVKAWRRAQDGETIAQGIGAGARVVLHRDGSMDIHPVRHGVTDNDTARGERLRAVAAGWNADKRASAPAAAKPAPVLPPPPRSATVEFFPEHTHYKPKPQPEQGRAASRQPREG